MSTRNRLTHIRNRRERRLGWIIVTAGLIIAGFALWSWIETFYYKRQLFDLYFSETVQGLSVGADVITDGQTIGQVQSIRLCTLSKDGTRENYAVVTIYADFRSLWGTHRLLDNPEDFRKRIRSEIQNGLRTRLFMRSLIANGLNVEIFFDREKPAIFVNDPECKNIELPTLSSTLSQHIDQVNAAFEKYKIKELGAKLQAAEKQIAQFNALLDTIDFPALNSAVLRKTETLKNSLSAEAFNQHLVALDQNLTALANSLEAGEVRTSAFFKDTAAFLKDLSDFSRTLGNELPSKTQAGAEALIRLRERLEAYRKTLREYTEALRQNALPVQESR